ncbi:MAG: phosphoribosylamine--glycine ligase [Dissulfurispiraceae bacterium]|jgi:phosphoribosylamine--glycine ligase|nr:phosphoribosylamine--glycine ligase [Dissulfurispiraceae bacterium]
MKVLVIGSGGREHAIVWKLSQSRLVDKIYCAPGNAGIADMAECVDIDLSDFTNLLDFVKYEWIDLTIVGPEEPLSRGIADAFEKEGRRIFAPVKAGAMLETSKTFCKDFLRRYRIPTADYKVFTSYLHAEDYVRMKGLPIVIKADGLAAGKGVFISSTFDEAKEALKIIMKDRAFGDAGDRVVIEECLEGEEASYIAFTDGKTIVPMVSSQDHKRIFDNDKGPNTGGMGTYSPAPVVTPEIEEKIMERVMRPTLEGLKRENIKYKGVLYAGLMIKDGEPKLLEYNCRFGDPETQVILTRLKSDLAEVALAVSEERLADINVEWHDNPSVCVVLASGGYPGHYEKGKIIRGLKEAAALENVTTFHAGTSFKGNDIVTSGGRVLGVTALGSTIAEAKKRAYEAVSRISFDGMQFRKDISDKALMRMQENKT